MTTLRKYNDNWIPSIFDDFFDNTWMRQTNATAPAINVSEDEAKYTVELAAPGMTKEDFQIHVDNEGNLTIAMEKKEENKEENKCKRYLRREFNYAKYQQTLILPDDVDKQQIGAKMADGVLRIDLHKLTPEKKEAVKRQISIE